MTPEQFSSLTDDLKSLPDTTLAITLSAMTLNPMPVAALETWLDEQNLAERSLSGGLEGTLVTFVADETKPVDLRNAVSDLLKHVMKRNSEIVSTHGPTRAVQVSSVLGGLVMLGELTVDQVTSFYDLAGGLKYGLLTTDEVSTARVAADLQSQRKAALFAALNRSTLAAEAAQESYRSGGTSEQITEAAVASWETD
jgi:hypothetical protein